MIKAVLNIKLICLLICFLFLVNSSFAQNKGCTDPKAKNYDSLFEINDGSCLYKQTNYKPEIISNLSDKIDESSGLIYFNEKIWTLNDGGGKAEIYAIDTVNGQISQTIGIKNASNIDWEELAQDSHFIYIGDFGNNNGKRKNLAIYKISKNKIPQKDDVKLQAEIITFSYPDQKDFKPDHQNHDFDCEAFICINETLYLFTKNWKSNHTKLYSLPSASGNYKADLLDSFNVEGLITAVDNKSNNELILLGYKNFKPFIWLLYDFKGNDFFGGNKRRIDFSNLRGCQSEGIAYLNSNEIIFSSEKNTLVKNQLYKIYTDKWIVHNNQPIVEEKTHQPSIFIEALSENNIINIRIENNYKKKAKIIIYDKNNNQIRKKHFCLSKKTPNMMVVKMPENVVGNYKVYVYLDGVCQISEVYFNQID